MRPSRRPLRALISLAVLAGVCAAYADGEGVTDPPGVTVALNGSTLLHRSPVPYPAAARQAGIQGTVVVEATLDAKGNVTDARVLSGPAELRRTVLESLLQWHFTQDASNSTRQVSIQFELPPQANVLPRGPDFNPALVVLQPAPAGPIGKLIRSIQISGIPMEARTQLLARLPVHEGDVLSQEAAENTVRAVKEFDEHLRVGFVTPDGDTTIQIMLPGYSPALALPLPAQPPSAPGRIRVAASLLQAKLKSSVPPDYPALARQARIQGVVKLTGAIGKDGSVQSLTVLSGHPLLVPAAIDAVKRWVYEPVTINGAAAEVESEIDVNFSLAPE